MSFLIALWFSFTRFIGNLFSTTSSSSSTPLPVPVTARRRSPSPAPDSPRTPTPSDRSISLTTMSDGSLEVISLGDRLADMGPLPSPWSPIGRKTTQDVWMSVDGMLMNATGPLDDDPDRTAMLSLSRMSTVSLYSSSSALGTFGISVFANLDEQDSDAKFTPKTPPKRFPTHSSKRFSTPLAKRDNDVHTTPVSSLAYELRMGLFADGRSMSAFDNIIPLLDQASPESIPPSNDAVEVI